MIDRDIRLEKMIALRKAGKTLNAVAAAVGITRERVRQLLLPYNLPRNFRVAKARPRILCKQCGKEFLDLYLNGKRKFCSGVCSGLFRRLPLGEKKKRNLARRAKWHKKNGQDIRFKKATWLRNRGVKGVSIHDADLMERSA